MVKIFDRFDDKIFLEIKKGEFSLSNLKDGRKIRVITSSLEHPRFIVSNFYILEKKIRKAMNKLLSKSYFQVAPILYVQVLYELDGGVDFFDVSLCRDICLSFGRECNFVKGTKKHSTKDVLNLSVPVEKYIEVLKNSLKLSSLD